MSENIGELGPTTTGDVYRVNPMDRDTGGHSHQPFDTYANPEDEEQARKKKDIEAKRQEAARQARHLEDQLSLSASALKAIEQAGHPSIGESGTPEPKAGPNGEEPEPADDSDAQSPHAKPPANPPPPPPHIDFVA